MEAGAGGETDDDREPWREKEREKPTGRPFVPTALEVEVQLLALDANQEGPQSWPAMRQRMIRELQEVAHFKRALDPAVQARLDEGLELLLRPPGRGGIRVERFLPAVEDSLDNHPAMLPFFHWALTLASCAQFRAALVPLQRKLATQEEQEEQERGREGGRSAPLVTAAGLLAQELLDHGCDHVVWGIRAEALTRDPFAVNQHFLEVPGPGRF